MSKIVKLETSLNNGERAKPKLKLIQGGKKGALKETLSSPEAHQGEQIFKSIIICANKANMTAKEIKHQCDNTYGEGIFEEHQSHQKTVSDLYQTLLAA